MNSPYKLLIVAGILLVIAGGGYLILQMPAADQGIEAPAPEEGTDDKEPPSESESTPEEAPVNPPPGTKPSQPQTTQPTIQKPPLVSPQTQRTGRLVITITDDAIALPDVDSIFISITNIETRNIEGVWVPITKELRTYDLLMLKRESRLELMHDISISEGIYNQLRLTMESVVIVKNGLANTAKLPAHTITLPLSLPLRTNQTAAIMIDVVADKSLHTTVANQLIFAPVLRVDVMGEVQTVQKSGSKVEFFGGLPKYAASFGMIETGVMQQNSLGIDSLSRIELEQNTFVLIPHSIERSRFTISPGAAIDTAKSMAALTGVSAVYGTLTGKQPVWLVAGTINGRAINAYVDGVTGTLVKVE